MEKKYYLFFGIFSFSLINTSFAECINTTGGNENNQTGSQYIQNSIIDCTGDTVLTKVTGNSSYALGNIQIAKETSQIIRWSNLPDTPGYSLGVNVEDGAVVTGTNLEKGALLIHSGYYTSRGLGVDVSNPNISPKNPITAKILNNGTVNYLNPDKIQNNDKNISTAISIEGNDAPANQVIINNGTAYSESAWSVLSSGVAVKDIYLGSLFIGQELIKIDDYKFSSENVISIINNGDIIQDVGEIKSGTLYDGHSAGLAVIQPSAKSISIINTESALIKGSFSGVDLLANRTQEKSILYNEGKILGGNRGISITKGNISDTIGFDPYFGDLYNASSGYIEGGQSGIFNQGTIESIENYGLIKGNLSSIDTSNGAVEKEINNYGRLEGDVLLGNNHLNLISSSDSKTLQPEIIGNISGDSQSSVSIKSFNSETNFIAVQDADVGSIYIDKNSQLTLADEVTWTSSLNKIQNFGRVSMTEDALNARFSGDFSNAGMINLGCENCKAKSLFIDGNYNGATPSSFLTLHTKLEGDLSETDKLIINGNATGITLVDVKNKGGTGAQTVNGIEVIKTTSSEEGAFKQSGRIVAGAYDYILRKGSAQNENPESWYLVSHLTKNDPIYRPEIGSYLSSLHAARTMFDLRFYDREGDFKNIASDNIDRGSAWIRMYNSNNEFETSSAKLKNKGDKFVFQIGKDLLELETPNSKSSWYFGVMAGYGNASSHTKSKLSGNKSKGSLNGFSIGGYGTWLQDKHTQNGAYLDSWVMVNHFKNSVNGSDVKNEKHNLSGISASIESGYKLKLANSLNYDYSLTPQGQIIWSNIRFNSFTDSNSAYIKNKNNNDIMLRVGLRGSISPIVKDSAMSFNSFAEVNWIHNTKNNGVSFDGENFYSKSSKNIGELKLGFEKGLSNSSSAWISAGKQWGRDNYSDININIGLKYNFN